MTNATVETKLDTSLSRKCDSLNCPNPGIWHPVLVFRHKSQAKAAAIRGVIPIRLCDDCRRIARPESLLTDALWNEVSTKLLETGRRKPTRSFTEIDFTIVGGPEATRFFRQIPENLRAQI